MTFSGSNSCITIFFWADSLDLKEAYATIARDDLEMSGTLSSDS